MSDRSQRGMRSGKVTFSLISAFAIAALAASGTSAQAADAGTEIGRVVIHGRLGGCGVEWIAAGDDAEKRRTLAGCLRHDADLVEPRGEGD